MRLLNHKPLIINIYIANQNKYLVSYFLEFGKTKKNLVRPILLENDLNW